MALNVGHNLRKALLGHHIFFIAEVTLDARTPVFHQHRSQHLQIEPVEHTLNPLTATSTAPEDVPLVEDGKPTLTQQSSAQLDDHLCGVSLEQRSEARLELLWAHVAVHFVGGKAFDVESARPQDRTIRTLLDMETQHTVDLRRAKQMLGEAPFEGLPSQLGNSSIDLSRAVRLHGQQHADQPAALAVRSARRRESSSHPPFGIRIAGKRKARSLGLNLKGEPFFTLDMRGKKRGRSTALGGKAGGCWLELVQATDA